MALPHSHYGTITTIREDGMALSTTDVVRVSAIMGTTVSGAVINTFDLRIQAEGDDGNDGFAEAVNNWANALYGTIEDQIASTVGFVRFEFLHRNGTEIIVPRTWATPPSPACSADSLPHTVAGLVYARSVRRGSRARKFLPPFCETENVNGQPSSGALLAMQDFANVWLDPWTDDNGWEFKACLWTGPLAGELEFVDATVSNYWAQQRRRRPGRGI